MRIDREPDFFALLRARGDVVVFVARCEGNVIGCMSAAVHQSYVRGVLENIAHVGDLKVHPLFSGKRLSLRLISALEARLRSQDVDLCFSLVAEGNCRVLPISEGKHGTPAVVHLGRFIVEQLIPSPFRGKSRHYRIEETAREDLPAVAAMLDSTCRQRQFAPRITAAHLEGAFPSAGAEGFAKRLAAREAGRVVATLAVEDTRAQRQNVLMGLPTALRAALAVLRVLAMPIPGVAIPLVGHPLTILYARQVACAEGREDALRLVIVEARPRLSAGSSPSCQSVCTSATPSAPLSAGCRA